MKIGEYEFDFAHHTYVMGILNMTPDSFSDGGKWNSMDIALRHVQDMIRDGAAMIDVGGESTRPGYIQVSDDEEIYRTAPVIEKIKSEFNIPISIDTYKSGVAKAAVAAGADLINDIWGLKYDPELAAVVADSNAFYCLMHNRNEIFQTTASGSVHDSEKAVQEFLHTVFQDINDSLTLAKQAGIQDDHIILDPGVGFGKNYEQNLQIIKHLDQFHTFGYPLLLGTSRKSVIGLTLDLPADERVEGTIATSVWAVLAKCGFVRVHDVKENVRAIRMMEAIAETL